MSLGQWKTGEQKSVLAGSSCLLIFECDAVGVQRVNFGKMHCGLHFAMTVESIMPRDLLSELMSVRDIPLPEPTSVKKNKNNQDVGNSSPESNFKANPVPPGEKLSSKDSWKLRSKSFSDYSPAGSDGLRLTPLPMYTKELSQSDFTNELDDFIANSFNLPAYPLNDGGPSSVLAMGNSDDIHRAVPRNANLHEPLPSGFGYRNALLLPPFPMGVDPGAQRYVIADDPQSHSPSFGCVPSLCRVNQY
jgi:hypothetical protein